MHAVKDGLPAPSEKLKSRMGIVRCGRERHEVERESATLDLMRTIALLLGSDDLKEFDLEH